MRDILNKWHEPYVNHFTEASVVPESLDSGFYEIKNTNAGVCLKKKSVISDGLHQLPGSDFASIRDDIETFWSQQEKYNEYALSYKRGFLFYGLPGSGKTAMIMMLCHELVDVHDGLVVIGNEQVDQLASVLSMICSVEPKRKTIVVLEDIDSIIRHDAVEQPLLSLLDGEKSVNNTVFMASTNYPWKLPARIVNRPSRFDRRIAVNAPLPITREAYLQKVLKGTPLCVSERQQWVSDTEGMPLSHLRELVIAVRVLGQRYEDAVGRLKTMLPSKADHERMRDWEIENSIVQAPVHSAPRFYINGSGMTAVAG